MGYRVDNIPNYAERANDRIINIVCASNGWSRQYFSDNFTSGGDDVVAAEFNRVSAKYGMDIAMEEFEKSSG